VDVVRLTSDSRTRTAGSNARVKKILQALKAPTTAPPRCASRDKATLELLDEAGNDVGKGEIACGRGTLHMKGGEEIEIAAKLDDLEDRFEGSPYVGDAVWGITSVTISDVRAGKKKTIRDKASVARAVQTERRRSGSHHLWTVPLRRILQRKLVYSHRMFRSARSALTRTRSAVLVATLLAGTILGCGALFGVDFGEAHPIANDAASDLADFDTSDEAVTDAGPRFCDTELKPKPKFCDDFDREGSVTTGWEEGNADPYPGAQGGGLLGPDLSTFWSPPRSLRTTTPALLTQSDQASAFLRTSIPVSSTIEVRFRVKVETEDYATGGNAIIAAVIFDRGGVILTRDALGAALNTAPRGHSARSSLKMQIGSWRSVAIFVINAPQAGETDGLAQLVVEGETAAEVLVPSAYQSTQSISIHVGPTVGGPAAEFAANFDDITIYYR
jgi:hypothetical protein